MDLNTILIILGIIALIILVVHGLWANRREKSQYFKSANTFTRDSRLREPPAHIQSASEEKKGCEHQYAYRRGFSGTTYLCF